MSRPTTKPSPSTSIGISKSSTHNLKTASHRLRLRLLSSTEHAHLVALLSTQASPDCPSSALRLLAIQNGTSVPRTRMLLAEESSQMIRRIHVMDRTAQMQTQTQTQTQTHSPLAGRSCDVSGGGDGMNASEGNLGLHSAASLYTDCEGDLVAFVKGLMGRGRARAREGRPEAMTFKEFERRRGDALIAARNRERDKEKEKEKKRVEREGRKKMVADDGVEGFDETDTATAMGGGEGVSRVGVGAIAVAGGYGGGYGDVDVDVDMEMDGDGDLGAASTIPASRDKGKARARGRARRKIWEDSEDEADVLDRL